MSEQDTINYDRIAMAIQYIKENFKDQPNLDEVAQKVHLSSFHFQRLFKEWAGVSPKKFLQYISVQHAKSILKDNQNTLFDTAYETGLSGTGRLHDLFIKIEGMTPGEFKNGGENLIINYSFEPTIFGHLLIASTTKGICFMAFTNQISKGLSDLKSHFPKAFFINQTDSLQEEALRIFSINNWSELSKIRLHLKGTEFQLKVWETLLKIPLGQCSTYGSVAAKINNPKASRAVGTAIGSNLVAFLIPCHRVLQSSGDIGGYKWGPTRKAAMLGWEASKIESK